MKKLADSKIYKTLIDTMNEGVWVGDKNERTVYANPKFCKMVGYKLPDMIGRESYDFWTEESVKRVRNVNTSERKKGVSSSYEGDLLTKNGKIVPVLLSGAPLPDGGTIGIMTDLTDLKKKEEEEKVLSQAIQYSTNAVITFDPDGKVKSWNKGAKIIFGYKGVEMVGAKISRIFSRGDVGEIISSSKVIYNIELEGKHKNKKKILVAATLTPIFIEGKKKVSFYLIIARDITNQVKFEEDVELKYRKMKEAYNKFGVIRRQMDYVFELLDVCRSSGDLKSMADFVVSSIIMLTRVDACVLRLYNQKRDSLDLLSSFGLANDWEGKASIKYKGGLAEKAFVQKGSVKIIDVMKDPKYQSKFLANKNNLCSLLLIPLVFKSKLVGTLSLYTSPEKKLEIFENEFIEKYAKLIELSLAAMV
ncbi:PAS domain S-box protein [Candidatus Peregrinibacteria bacterium]|nr:PAS domain S-box protein [Candidatus Peregrinibacteria bacterium]MBT4055894.1 PAS domain S-box protein [Candidatus Peregrinibacteria bacterium]